MDAARATELRRWAETKSNGDAPHDVRAIARTALAILDNPDSVGQSDLSEARRWAQRTAARGDTAHLRSVGRTILALSKEIEPPRPERPSPARLLQRAKRVRRSGSAQVLRGPEERWTVDFRGALESRRNRQVALIVAGLCLAIGLLVGAYRAARAAFAPVLAAAGPPQGARLGPATLDGLAFAVHAPRQELATQRWTLDGRNVTSLVRPQGDALVFRPHDLREGAHDVEISSGRGFLGFRTVLSFPFVVDLTPPRIRLSRPASAYPWHPLDLTGKVENGAKVTVDGRVAKVEGDRFSVHYPPPLPRAITVTAVDTAGNRAVKRIAVTLIPRGTQEPIRAVHVTPYGWSDASLRRGVLQLIAQHRINAVEIDLKDEAGLVGFNPSIALARRIGAAQKIYDLGSIIRDMHARGIRVIGRIVCFRDPILAAAAWKAGRRNQVVQTPGGTPYAGYGGFTNFADPVVRKYNIDIARVAAQAGIDDILYDYVRRPDGPISTMVFPGLRVTPQRSIVGFLSETRLALRPYGTFLGASVFGVAATRPAEVAQNIPEMARQVDYIAPMVYPSHWRPGEYKVTNPNSEPYKIVLRSLRDFQRDAKGSGARIVPWLQDFSLGVTYGPAEVRAQIAAARRLGIPEFLLWNPRVTYTVDALDPNAPTSTQGLAKPKRAAPAAAPAKKTSSAKAKPLSKQPATPVRAVDGRMPNELGVVPVIMHHEIRPDRVGPYDQTPREFRTELERLWNKGYWPVTAADFVEGNLGSVPAGKTPVVLTFDDSTQFQFSYLPNGQIKPTTAVAILLEFARTHPGFKPAGTFYVLREPFAGVPRGPEMLRWLVDHGFELGDHTYDHLPLNTLAAGAVQRELVRGARVITDAVPGYRIRTMALPLGAMPKPARLALEGRWNGQAYRFSAVFLAGAEPALSPYRKGFDPGAVPRIRSSHLPWKGGVDFTWAFWQHQLDAQPGNRYVSDGDPSHVTFPRRNSKLLVARFRPLARAY